MAVAHEVTLIGLCDGAIVDKKSYPSSYLTNKIGDLPDLLPAMSWQNPCCDLCSAALAHVAQVYCPLDSSPYHRNLHLFACTSIACCGKPGSWKALRSQCLETDVKASHVPPPMPTHIPGKGAPMAATDWCDGADSWEMEEDWEDSSDTTQAKTHQNVEPETERVMSTTSELDVSDRLQGLSVGEVEKMTQKSIPTFCPFYISVVEESDLVVQTGLDHAQKLLKEYEKREGVAVRELDNCEGGGDEKYEKTKARHGDAVFFRFMKKISLCPEQILRYCWNGSPIFISEPPSNMEQMVPACSHCGSPRTFELQLMPALISLLRGKDSRSEMVVEFGTVLVYTCRNSCWTSGRTSPVDEFIFIQADPDKKFFK